MYSIADVESALALSRAATWNRIEAIRPVLEAKNCLRRGGRSNAVMLTSEGLQLLRILEDRHRQGLTLSQAAKEIAGELNVVQKEESDGNPLAIEIRLQQKQIKSLEKAIADLVDRVGSLEARIAPETRMLSSRVGQAVRRVFRRHKQHDSEEQQ